MANNLIFTRYLYNADEVVLTFIESLLKEKELNECYFWIYEYYKSGFEDETWSLLWKIYYDFYALRFPNLYKKIGQHYRSWSSNNNFIHIMHVVNNYHRFSKNTTHLIFLLRIYYSKHLFKCIKTDENIEYEKYGATDKYQKLLIHSILEKHWENAAYALRKNMDSEHLLDLLNNILERKIQLNKYYNDTFHQLLYIILYDKSIKTKYYCKRAIQKDLNNMLETNTSCRNLGKWVDCKNPVSYVYKTLPNKRLYSISSNIGCFKLKRNDVELKKMFWYNWEYFAYFSPLWKNRFDKYKITIDHEKKLINFDDIDEYEMFYEDYNYEPDEQSKEVQEKSTKDIPYDRLDNWINNVFDEKIKRKIRSLFEY